MSRLIPAGRRAVRAAWRPIRAVALGMVTLLLVSGCGFRVDELPLPGGADVGSAPYRVRVAFSDVLDLVPNAGVRVNDVPVGRVEQVGLAPDSFQAQVTVVVNGNVRLPANAVARLRQSSLLGEKFVELSAPAQPEPAIGRLRDGGRIGIERSGRNPEVEEVLGSLSLLLNGGGVGQLQNITRELNAAMSGRESDIRGALDNANKLVAGLDAQRDDITRALDGVNRLSARLNDQRGDIDVALRDLEPGLKVLNDQREQLVTMLKSLDRLSGTATHVVNRSQQDMVANLRDLQPTLNNLAAAGSNLPKSFQLLLTYPFSDEAVEGIKGDYTNLYLKADLDLTNIVGNLSHSKQPPVQLPGAPALPLPELPPQPPKPPKRDSGSDQGLLPTKQPSPSQQPSDGEDSGGLLHDLLGGS